MRNFTNKEKRQRRRHIKRRGHMSGKTEKEEKDTDKDKEWDVETIGCPVKFRFSWNETKI